jgi:hypothetical protein
MEHYHGKDQNKNSLLLFFADIRGIFLVHFPTSFSRREAIWEKGGASVKCLTQAKVLDIIAAPGKTGNLLEVYDFPPSPGPQKQLFGRMRSGRKGKE